LIVAVVPKLKHPTVESIPPEPKISQALSAAAATRGKPSGIPVATDAFVVI